MKNDIGINWKKFKKKLGVNTKKHNEKIRKIEENYNDYNHQLQKTKKTTKLQKKKQDELNKRRILIRKQNESNREIKQNERRQKRQKLIDEDIDLCDVGRFFELATSFKNYVNILNLHEIKNEILRDDRGDFELNRLVIIGPIEHKTIIRFKKLNEFESYINAIDIDYSSEDLTFTGHVYKLNTPQFNIVKRSVYAKGTIYMQKFVEYRGQNCYIPTSGMYFIECTLYLTKKDYKEGF